LRRAFIAGFIWFKGVKEVKARMGKRGRDEKVASKKKTPN